MALLWPVELISPVRKAKLIKKEKKEKMAYKCSGVCQSCQEAPGYWQEEGKEEERGRLSLLAGPSPQDKTMETASVRIPALLKDKITWKSTFLFLGWSFF